MPKTTGQKLKLLYLMRIFLAHSDESHKLTVNDLVSKLSEYDIKAERKTIYEDIEALRQFGLDIVMEKTKAYGYYVAGRDFELPELKLLADAVQSSKFITEKKSRELIKKLEGLVSVYDAGKLKRQVYIQNRVKNMNESIYYSVDTIHEAIAEGRKISFKYFEYSINKERVYRRDGAYYTVDPIALTWNEENYYLIAHSNDREGLSHYRVDRMNSVGILEEKRDKAVKGVNLAEYSKKIFGMFGGEETSVLLRVNNQLASAVIDRFGSDVMMIADGADHFKVSIHVVPSPIFYGWIFQFGELCTVLSPQIVIDELRNRAGILVSHLSNNK